MTRGSLDPGIMPAMGLLAQIRANTREAHDRIEAAPSLSCLLSPDLAIEEYVSALQILHSFQAGATRRVAAATLMLPETCRADPSRLRAIEADLTWFGVLPRRELVLPPGLGRREHALGAMYVVEGSSLGGRVIGRAVSRSLGVTADTGGAFFLGQTADAARDRWRNFVDSVNEFGEELDSCGRQHVVDGAIAAFAALETLLGNEATVMWPKPERSEHLAPATAGQS